MLDLVSCDTLMFVGACEASSFTASLFCPLPLWSLKVSYYWLIVGICLTVRPVLRSDNISLFLVLSPICYCCICQRNKPNPHQRLPMLIFCSHGSQSPQNSIMNSYNFLPILLYWTLLASAPNIKPKSPSHPSHHQQHGPSNPMLRKIK